MSDDSVKRTDSQRTNEDAISITLESEKQHVTWSSVLATVKLKFEALTLFQKISLVALRCVEKRSIAHSVRNTSQQF